MFKNPTLTDIHYTGTYVRHETIHAGNYSERAGNRILLLQKFVRRILTFNR